MCYFFSQDLSIGVVKLDNMFDRAWRLCCKCTLSQQVLNIVEIILVGERVNILEQLIFGDAGQRIFDSETISNERNIETMIHTLQ